MRKKYLKLTTDQKARNVIFSSQLLPNGTIHEVTADDPEGDTRIARLLDDSFFNGSPFEANEVRR